MHRFPHVQFSKQWMLTLLQNLLIGLNLRNGRIVLSISVFTEWHTNYQHEERRVLQVKETQF